jgi:8-oxo-dGTP pyrophosphatase MutT (NUDIX family)
MHQPNQIRVLALGLIQAGGRVFMSEGYDPHQQRTFYRAMGGGVDFGETSQAALEREFQEEIGAALTNIHYLGCLETLFTFNGQPGHEIIQLYACDFRDPAFYACDRRTFNEGKRQKVALWVETERLRSGELLLVPEPFKAYL